MEMVKPIRSRHDKVQPKRSQKSLTKIGGTPSNILDHSIVRNIHSCAARGHKRSILINMMHLTLSDPHQNIKDERIARLAPPLSGKPQDHEIHEELKFFQSLSNGDRPTNEV